MSTQFLSKVPKTSSPRSFPHKCQYYVHFILFSWGCMQLSLFRMRPKFSVLKCSTSIMWSHSAVNAPIVLK